MILPTIISVSEASIRAVPQSYYEGGLALGASHERSVFFTVFAGGKKRNFRRSSSWDRQSDRGNNGGIDGCGKSAYAPESITSGVRTLTTNIVLEMGYATDMHREALIATAVVLFVFILSSICHSQ